MRRLHFVSTMVRAGLVVLLVGCASGAPVTPTSGSAPAGKPSAPQVKEEKPAAPLPTIKAAYVAPIGAMAPLFLAEESGAFKKYSVPVEVTFIQANAAVAALIAKEVDVLEVSAPALISANLGGGADLVMVAGLLNSFIFSLFGGKEVRSPQDLRGKVFATDRPGTPNEYGTQIALKKIGLRPDEVQILPVGSSDKVLGALQSGEVTGTVLTPPASFIAEREGYPRLVDLFDVPYQNVGMVVLRSRLDELAPSMVPFLRAIREGIQRYNSDKQLAMAAISKYTKETDPEILDKTYEFFRRQAPFNPSLSHTDEGFQGMLEFMTSLFPQAETAKASQFYDKRFLDKLGSP